MARKKIKAETTRGTFKNTAIREGRKKAAVLELNPKKKGQPNIYITEIHEQNTHTSKPWAAKQIQSRIGISKAAIKKLGL